MSSLLPVFTQPAALLLVLLAWLLLWWLHRLRQSGDHWQQRLPAAFRPWLLQQSAASHHQLPWLLLAAAALLAGLALSGPRLPGAQQPAGALPEPLVVIIELTPDMLASDLPPSRLHQLRRKAMQLVQAQLPGPTAMVVYAGSAHTLLPLSTDPAMADNLLQALHPALMPLPGRNAADAVARALELLQQGADGRGRIALLTRALDTNEQQAIARLIRQQPVRLGIIGVGSPQGAPVPDADTGQFAFGQPLSRLHEQSLQDFARRHGLGYARLDHGHLDLLHTRLFAPAANGQLQASANVPVADQGYWLLLPLLLLLAPLARRGWLLALLLALPLQPGDVLAGEPDSALLERIRQDPLAALQQLDDPLWLGIAAYHAGNYQLAHDYFATRTEPLAHYNRGNSLMQLARYAEAAAAYQQALQLQPGLRPAQDNLALARQLQAQTARPGHPGSQSADHYPPAAASPGAPGKTATLPLPDPDYQHGSLDSWLQQIPDNPATLLKRRFQRELAQPHP